MFADDFNRLQYVVPHDSRKRWTVFSAHGVSRTNGTKSRAKEYRVVPGHALEDLIQVRFRLYPASANNPMTPKARVDGSGTG